MTRVSSQSERLAGSELPPARAWMTSALLQTLFEAGSVMVVLICWGGWMVYCMLSIIFIVILLDHADGQVYHAHVVCRARGHTTLGAQTLLGAGDERTVVEHTADAGFLLGSKLEGIGVGVVHDVGREELVAPARGAFGEFLEGDRHDLAVVEQGGDATQIGGTVVRWGVGAVVGVVTGIFEEIAVGIFLLREGVEQTQIVAQLVGKGDIDVKLGLVEGARGDVVRRVGIAVYFVVDEIAVDGRTVGKGEVLLADVVILGLERREAVGLVDALQRERQMAHAQGDLGRVGFGGKGIDHHIDIVVGLPQIAGISLLVVVHEVVGVDGVGAVPFDVFHTGGGEAVAALVVGGEIETDVDILTGTDVGAVVAALVDAVDVVENIGETRGGDFLLHLGLVLVEYVEDNGQLVGVALVELGGGLVVVQVYLGCGVLLWAVVTRAGAEGEREHCHQHVEECLFHIALSVWQGGA